MKSPDEQLLFARDAYASAAVLAAVILVGQSIALLVSRGISSGLPSWIRLAQIVLSLLVLGALWQSRTRPRTALAFSACALLLVPQLVLVPYAAVRWLYLGRPFEAFLAPQIAMISVALVVPRSFWLGVATVLAFLFESVGIYFYFVHAGTPAATLPAGEPLLSLTFAVLGGLLLVLRKNRRDLGVRHLRASAEAVALARQSAQLRSFVEEMREPLEVLSGGLTSIRAEVAGAPKVPDRTGKAVDRLVSVRGQVERILAGEPPGAADGGVLAAPGTSAAPDPSELERRLYARDAQLTALALSGAAFVIWALAVPTTWGRSMHWSPILYASEALLAAIGLAVLYHTRARPSERRALVIELLVIVPVTLTIAYTQLQYAAELQAFEPYPGYKMLMASIPLVLTRRLWLGVALELFLLLVSVAVFHLVGMESLRDRIPLSEPWIMLVYFMVGIGLVVTRENRRIASVGLMRADLERDALLRQSNLSLALLDQLGTPLQVLSLTVGILRTSQSTEPHLKEMEAALERLTEASRRLPRVEPKTSAQLYASFDGARVLDRLD